MPRWHNSKRLLQQTPYASAYWLALQEERFIPYSDTLPYGTRTIHVALTPSSITACSTSTPLTSSSVLPWEKRIINLSNRLWAFRRRIQLSGTRCLATNVKPNRRGKRTPDSTINRKLPPWKPSIPLQFFYDNCATRPRDQIERAINGTLQYADNMTANSTGISFRDLLHKYSEGHLWSRFGMDLCMGSKADEPINRRLAMFVPFYMQEYFNKAQIVDKEGQARPLVAKEEKS